MGPRRPAAAGTTWQPGPGAERDEHGQEQGVPARVPPWLFTSCAAREDSASRASAFLSVKWGGGGKLMRSSTSGTFPVRPNNCYLIRHDPGSTGASQTGRAATENVSPLSPGPRSV